MFSDSPFSTSPFAGVASTPAVYFSNVSEGAQAQDASHAKMTFLCFVTETNAGVDTIVCRKLWENISNTETAGWQTVQTAQSATWQNVQNKM